MLFWAQVRFDIELPRGESSVKFVCGKVFECELDVVDPFSLNFTVASTLVSHAHSRLCPLCGCEA